MCEPHCDYTNYATFSIALFLEDSNPSRDGEGGRWHRMVRSQVARLRAMASGFEEVVEGTWTEEQAVRFKLANFLKAKVERENPYENQEHSIWGVLMSCAIDHVDWQDVADSFLTE